MKHVLLEILAKISLVIFSFLIVYYFAQGLTTNVWEGDSIAYHIPISNLILTGKIFNPGVVTYPATTDRGMVFSPGASEIILSTFTLLHVPLNLFDVLGIILFFFVMRRLGQNYELSDNSSIVFAASLATLHTIVRWATSQTIDVWLASFFGLSIILLRKPNKTYKYFLLLGLVLGMLIGSKYTGPIYAIFLLILFCKELIKKLNIKRLIVFLLPFTILGFFWYIRNYILTGDPYFPQSIPLFKGIPWHILDQPVWKMILAYPKVWLDAFISEYTVWASAIFIIPIIYVFYRKYLTNKLRADIVKLMILGYICFVIYFFLPSGPYPNLITSGFRYTYPALIPLILCLFIYAKKFAKEEILGVVAVTNMLIMPELSYHPKILIAIIPIALLIFYPSKIKQLKKHIKKRYTH